MWINMVLDVGFGRYLRAARPDVDVYQDGTDVLKAVVGYVQVYSFGQDAELTSV
jgi:hypothetical protein